jgi:acyl dehydratase
MESGEAGSVTGLGGSTGGGSVRDGAAVKGAAIMSRKDVDGKRQRPEALTVSGTSGSGDKPAAGGLILAHPARRERRTEDKESAMPETQCLTAAMLQVGMRHTARLAFTREQVDAYCALCGDRNAIHRDLEAARLRFPGVRDIVVPGGLVQISITGIFGSEFPGDGCLGLAFSPERFRKPVCPGDELKVTLEITKVRGPLLEVDVALYDETGEQLSAAKAKLMAADDAYRQWWEANRG